MNIINLKDLGDIEKYKLCLVLGNKIYFTKQSLEEQWGDDWDDAPYEHNAGEPYEENDGDILVCTIDTMFESPCSNVTNSHWSVMALNIGNYPWMFFDMYGHGDDISIYAGTTFKRFLELLPECTNVYIECKLNK